MTWRHLFRQAPTAPPWFMASDQGAEEWFRCKGATTKAEALAIAAREGHLFVAPADRVSPDAHLLQRALDADWLLERVNELASEELCPWLEGDLVVARGGSLAALERYLAAAFLRWLQDHPEALTDTWSVRTTEAVAVPVEAQA